MPSPTIRTPCPAPAPAPPTNAQDRRPKAKAKPQTTGKQPTGQYIPATVTEEKVNQGQRSDNNACSTCYGNALANGTMGPHLAGQVVGAGWKDKTVADLFTYSRDHMPPSRPHSLPDKTYAAITAYILRVNGAAPGAQPVRTDPDALANRQIVIENVG